MGKVMSLLMTLTILLWSRQDVKCQMQTCFLNCSTITIHVIFSWTQIGRFGFTDREIGSQIGRFFRGKASICGDPKTSFSFWQKRKIGIHIYREFWSVGRDSYLGAQYR